MAHCLTEEWIEQIAIDHLGDPRAALPEHLSHCEFCNSAFLSISKVHQDALTNLEEYDDVDSLLRIENHPRLNNPHTFLLNPLEERIPELSTDRIQNTLAADSPRSNESLDRVKNLGVFSSIDGRLIIRIIQGTDSQITLFLLSDREELYKNVLVRILGMDSEYISDAHGRIQLGEIELPDLVKLGIEVRTAIGQYDLKTIFANSEQLIGESEIVLGGDSAKQVKMEIIPVGGSYSLKVSLEEYLFHGNEKRIKVMVVRNDQPPLIQSSVQGVVLFQELQDPRAVLVNIFE